MACSDMAYHPGMEKMETSAHMSKRDLTITLAGLCIIAALATFLFYWLGTIKPEMATLRWVDIPAINIMGALYAAHIIHIYKHPEQDSDESERP